MFVPETYHPVLLRRKAQRLRKETGNENWQAPIEKMDRSIPQTIIRSIYRPFQLLTLEPMCLNLCIYSAILLGVLYLFFGAFAIVFEHNHGFQLWQIGLTFVGLLVGSWQLYRLTRCGTRTTFAWCDNVSKTVVSLVAPSLSTGFRQPSREGFWSPLGSFGLAGLRILRCIG